MTTPIYKYSLVHLRACTDLSDLATLLNVKPQLLSYVIYHSPKTDRYAAFDMPKKGGGKRSILAPNDKLKFMQSRLSRLLYQCYFDIHGKPDNSKRVLSHGFQKWRDLSIITNAQRHTGKRYVINFDLEDFFPSINFGRVRGFFINHDKFKLNDKVATAIAQLACHNNELPQGAPSSPIISEFIAQHLDNTLNQLAKKHGCHYSRYVDDITFSTNKKKIPTQIAEFNSASKRWEVGGTVLGEVNRCGFDVNPSKTRIQDKYQRQATTNLTVNKKVNVDRRYYMSVRVAAHSMMTKGSAYSNANIAPNHSPLSINQLWGMLSFINNVKKASNLESHKDSQIYKQCKDFYFYKHITQSAEPIILTEGWTDVVYLKEAINYYAENANYQQTLTNLLKPQSSGSRFPKNSWKVRFLRNDTQSKNFLGLRGGTGSINNFIAFYSEQRHKKNKDD